MSTRRTQPGGWVKRRRMPCRWCGGEVPRRRLTFCSAACVHEWKIRSSPSYVRQQVKKRDKGVCQLCGFNVVKAHREWTRSKPPKEDRPGRKSVTFRLTVGSPERTLSSEEVGALRERIIEGMRRLGYELRV